MHSTVFSLSHTTACRHVGAFSFTRVGKGIKTAICLLQQQKPTKNTKTTENVHTRFLGL